ncbi:hypothetical protein SS05631_a45420 (plasmid) [Sinorhizobium sp. CCBAU 05631]|nr:hypothetical protein SS05631_a45420 [Sinorhizobium sp. CCBAU 05631]AWM30020.1 hypothetical protein AOX55_00004586 [Sinorhizobium fredii CCBAU 25509]
MSFLSSTLLLCDFKLPRGILCGYNGHVVLSFLLRQFPTGVALAHFL